MFDFTSDFWSWFIIIPVVVGLVAMIALNMWMTEKPKPKGEEPKPMGHVWDEDLQELNNPLPKWWLQMFYITIFFSIGYLVLYPGLGSFKGLLGWTQEGQYNTEVQKAEETFGPIYANYLKQDATTLMKDPEAHKTGQRLFGTYCAICHGSDARGSHGFPNLRDYDWLYGGTTDAIKVSIAQGRVGSMPPWEAALGKEGVFDVSEYVLSLSGRDVNTARASKGKEKYNQMCVACHGADGKGNLALGAPNLTDNTWLYGGSQRAVIDSISNGRNGKMPKHEGFLDEAKIHLLTAYVYSLSTEDKTAK